MAAPPAAGRSGAGIPAQPLAIGTKLATYFDMLGIAKSGLGGR
jgi:hypothetical protein